MNNSLIQLPDDVQLIGYKETRPYHHEAVFYSPLADFRGTEKDFLQSGHAYRYFQADKYTRIALA